MHKRASSRDSASIADNLAQMNSFSLSLALSLRLTLLDYSGLLERRIKFCLFDSGPFVFMPETLNYAYIWHPLLPATFFSLHANQTHFQ